MDNVYEFTNTSKEYPERDCRILKRIIPSTGMDSISIFSPDIDNNKDLYSVKIAVSQQRRNRLIDSDSDSSSLPIYPVFPKKNSKRKKGESIQKKENRESFRSVRRLFDSTWKK